MTVMAVQLNIFKIKTAMKIELTKKEISLLDSVLNTIADSDYFDERQPEGIKSAKEANKVLDSILVKLIKNKSQ